MEIKLEYHELARLIAETYSGLPNGTSVDTELKAIQDAGPGSTFHIIAIITKREATT